MKKRMLVWMLVLGMSAAMLPGCGGSEEKSEEKSQAEETTEQSEDASADVDEKEKEQEKLEGRLREAVEKQIQEKMWGTKGRTVRVYADGEEEETMRLERTIDNEKQIAMELYHFSTNDQTEFWTKEGENEYQYTEVHTNEGDKEFRKVVCENDEEKVYDRLTKGMDLPFDSTERREVLECETTDDGEDGDSVKIKIVERYKLKPEYFFQEMTREFLLEENGWTEDDVKRVEGASEAIDAYVAENESNIAKNKENVYETVFTYWLTKGGHELVKSECSEQPLVAEYKAQGEFFRISAKIDGYEYETADEEEREIKETVTCTEYVTGDDCAPIENFPKDAKEVTREQYMNGEL